jgi:hypothetical protein
MGQTKGPDQAKTEFLHAAEAMYEELRTWRASHLDASFDEIANQVTPRRRALMGKLLSELATAADERIEAPVCEQCGAVMSYRGTPERQVGHREGDVGLARAYYACDHCGGGLFPP